MFVGLNPTLIAKASLVCATDLSVVSTTIIAAIAEVAGGGKGAMRVVYVINFGGHYEVEIMKAYEIVYILVTQLALEASTQSRSLSMG